MKGLKLQCQHSNSAADARTEVGVMCYWLRVLSTRLQDEFRLSSGFRFSQCGLTLVVWLGAEFLLAGFSVYSVADVQCVG